MKIQTIAASVMLLGILLCACTPAMAQILPEELEITTKTHEAPTTSDLYTVQIEWQDYHLTVVPWGNSAHFRYTPPTPIESIPFLALEPKADVPELELAQLPADMSEPLRVCIDMAIAALEKDKGESELKSAAREILSLISKRRFVINDYSSYGHLSSSWRRNYSGGGRTNCFEYKDFQAWFDLEGSGEGCSLTLQERPSVYSAEVALKGDMLTAKALKAGGRGLPDEAELLEFLREITSRAHGLASSDYCDAPDDVVDMLARLTDALATATHFDAYEEMEEAICPT